MVNGHRLITAEHIPSRIRSNLPPQKRLFTQHHLDLVEDMGLKEFMNHFKKEIVNEYLKRNGGNLRQSAKSMKIAPSTLSEMLSVKEKSL